MSSSFSNPAYTGATGASETGLDRPLRNDEIMHEGPLSIRQTRGMIGLRRWLSRYFILCKADWTLRRYRSLQEAENPTKPARAYALRDVDFIRADGATRFLITMADGTEVKLAAENSSDTREWPRLALRQQRPVHSLWGCERLELSNHHSPPTPTHCSLRAFQVSGCWPFKRL